MKQHLQNELEQLRVQLKTTSERLKEEKNVEKISSDFQESCSNLEKMLNDAQLNVFENVKSVVNAYIESKPKDYEESGMQKKVLYFYYVILLVDVVQNMYCLIR